jgi:hypothetical protein
MAAAVYAQQPLWLLHKPPKAATYYYRIAHAKASTEEEAHTLALTKIIVGSAMAVDNPQDMLKLLRLRADSALVMEAPASNIPFNEVCSHAEKLVSEHGYRVYVLCQVANDARIAPQYRDFNCYTNKEEQ